MRTDPYPSDLTDEQWTILQPLVPPPAKLGRPPDVDMREVLNAIFYLNRSGCSWRMLPRDFPKWRTVYNYFAAWRNDGTWERMVTALRERVRVADGREPTPSACVVDSQSVKTAAQGGEQGYDAAKRIKGRKRHIAVDTLGLLLAVAVTAASVDDAKGAEAVFEQMHPELFPRLEKVWADNKYHNYGLYDWVGGLSRDAWELEVVLRPDDAVGFVVVRKRWVVERTLTWLGRYRRHAKDYERLTESSEAMIRISSIHIMLRKLRPRKLKRTARFRYKLRKKRAA